MSSGEIDAERSPMTPHRSQMKSKLDMVASCVITFDALQNAERVQETSKYKQVVSLIHDPKCVQAMSWIFCSATSTSAEISKAAEALQSMGNVLLRCSIELPASKITELCKMNEIVHKSLLRTNRLEPHLRVQIWSALANLLHSMLSSAKTMNTFTRTAQGWFTSPDATLLNLCLDAWPRFFSLMVKSSVLNKQTLRDCMNICCRPLIHSSVAKAMGDVSPLFLALVKLADSLDHLIEDVFEEVVLPFLVRCTGREIKIVQKKEGLAEQLVAPLNSDSSLLSTAPFTTQKPCDKFVSLLFSDITYIFGCNPDHPRMSCVTRVETAEKHSVLLMQALRLALSMDNNEQRLRVLAKCVQILRVLLKNSSQEERSLFFTQWQALLTEANVPALIGMDIAGLMDSSKEVWSWKEKTALLCVLIEKAAKEGSDLGEKPLHVFKERLLELKSMENTIVAQAEIELVVVKVAEWVESPLPLPALISLSRALITTYSSIVSKTGDVNEGISRKPAVDTAMLVLSLPLRIALKHPPTQDTQWLRDSFREAFDVLHPLLDTQPNLDSTAIEMWLNSLRTIGVNKPLALLAASMSIRVVIGHLRFSGFDLKGEVDAVISVVHKMYKKCVEKWKVAAGLDEVDETDMLLFSSSVKELAACLVGLFSSSANSTLKCAMLLRLKEELISFSSICTKPPTQSTHCVMVADVAGALAKVMALAREWWSEPADCLALSSLSPLLVACLDHPDKAVKEAAARFWETVFAHKVGIRPSDELRSALDRAQESYPDLLHGEHSSTSSFLPSQSDKDLEEVPIQLFASPKTKSGMTEKKPASGVERMKEEKENARLPLHDEDTIAFFVPEETASPKRQRMTERQKEMLMEERERLPYLDEDSRSCMPAIPPDFADSQQSLSCTNSPTEEEDNGETENISVRVETPYIPPPIAPETQASVAVIHNVTTTTTKTEGLKKRPVKRSIASFFLETQARDENEQFVEGADCNKEEEKDGKEHMAREEDKMEGGETINIEEGGEEKMEREEEEEKEGGKTVPEPRSRRSLSKNIPVKVTPKKRGRRPSRNGSKTNTAPSSQYLPELDMMESPERKRVALSPPQETEEAVKTVSTPSMKRVFDQGTPSILKKMGSPTTAEKRSRRVHFTESTEATTTEENRQMNDCTPTKRASPASPAAVSTPYSECMERAHEMVYPHLQHCHFSISAVLSSLMPHPNNNSMVLKAELAKAGILSIAHLANLSRGEAAKLRLVRKPQLETVITALTDYHYKMSPEAAKGKSATKEVVIVDGKEAAVDCPLVASLPSDDGEAVTESAGEAVTESAGEAVTESAGEAVTTVMDAGVEEGNENDRELVDALTCITSQMVARLSSGIPSLSLQQNAFISAHSLLSAIGHASNLFPSPQ